jgi:hypothetical protein
MHLLCGNRDKILNTLEDEAPDTFLWVTLLGIGCEGTSGISAKQLFPLFFPCTFSDEGWQAGGFEWGMPLPCLEARMSAFCRISLIS